MKPYYAIAIVTRFANTRMTNSDMLLLIDPSGDAIVA
jgi:hypothetical protein